MMAPTPRGGVFALGLPGVSAGAALPTGEGWDELLASAVDERAVPFVANGVRGGLVDASADQMDALAGAHEELMRSCVVLERAALDCASHFDGAGIEFRLLKGAAVAHLDYPDPSWRAFGDVDILVRSASYDAAVAALEHLGGRRRSGQVRPGFDRRFGKGVCIIMASGIQVDVHRTLATGPFGLTVDLDALFGGHDRVEFGGRSLPVLSREHRFLHACFHAALGDATPRIVAQRDVAQFLLATDLDFDAARMAAAQWRARIVVAHAIDRAWARLELEPNDASRWAASYRPSRFEHRSLAAYLGPERSYARQMVAGVPAVRGLSNKIAYVRSLLLVDPEYVQRHDGGYGRRLQRAWKSRVTREQVT